MSDEKNKSLWPDLGLNLSELKSPIAIVKEQANQLALQTRGIVVAKVFVDREDINNYEDSVNHTFSLTCPPLGSYSVQIFHITTQLASLYPVKITSSFLRDGAETPRWEINNEPELIAALTELFSHRKTIAAVESMMAHAGAEPKKKKDTKADSDDGDVPF
jgi:hypothetical protein